MNVRLVSVHGSRLCRLTSCLVVLCFAYFAKYLPLLKREWCSYDMIWLFKEQHIFSKMQKKSNCSDNFIKSYGQNNYFLHLINLNFFSILLRPIKWRWCCYLYNLCNLSWYAVVAVVVVVAVYQPLPAKRSAVNILQNILSLIIVLVGSVVCCIHYHCTKV